MKSKKEVAPEKAEATPGKIVPQTVPDHTYQPTSDPDLFRVVDRDGNWNFYFKKSTGQYAPAVNHVIRSGFNKGPRFAQWLLSVSKDEAKKILESAGDRGSRVHMAIRELLDGQEVKIDKQYPSETQGGRFEPLTGEEWNCIQGFASWVVVYKPEVMRQEVTVFSDAELYAGTIDFLGVIDLPGVGKISVLVDWKSSSGIWDEYKLQVAAYYQAWLEVKDNKGFVPTHTAIVRVGTKHKQKFEMQVFDAKETMENYARFLEARNLYRFVDSQKEPTIEQLPTSFKFEVPKWQPPAPQAENGAKKKPRSRIARKKIVK